MKYIFLGSDIPLFPNGARMGNQPPPAQLVNYNAIIRATGATTILTTNSRFPYKNRKLLRNKMAEWGIEGGIEDAPDFPEGPFTPLQIIFHSGAAETAAMVVAECGIAREDFICMDYSIQPYRAKDVKLRDRLVVVPFNKGLRAAEAVTAIRMLGGDEWVLAQEGEL